MSYIQNKLDEFDYKTAFIFSPSTENNRIRSIIRDLIEQALTDYHNHIVEKIESKIGDLRIEKMIDFDSEKYYGSQIENFQTLIDQLQDTNPKE